MNKKSYKGPTEYQSKDVTETLIERVLAGAKGGVKIRRLTNSGDGEPTLHADFPERMDMFGEMLRKWPDDNPVPELSIVTNGSNLTKQTVLDTLARNKVTVNVSFPTSNPEAYGEIMFDSPEKGKKIFDSIAKGVQNVMALKAQGAIPEMYFHVSPPERDIIRRDFPETIDFLTKLAKNVNLDAITLVMFPVTSNRSGLIRNRIKGMDTYADLVKKYNGTKIEEWERKDFEIYYMKFAYETYLREILKVGKEEDRKVTDIYDEDLSKYVEEFHPRFY